MKTHKERNANKCHYVPELYYIFVFVFFIISRCKGEEVFFFLFLIQYLHF